MLDKIFKDKDGKFVVWQRPNALLLFWAIFTVTAILVPSGQVKNLLNFLAFVAICAWAFLEVIFGVNYFRRILGVAVLILSLINKLN